MDKTELVAKVTNLFRISGYKVDQSVKINHREIDIRAEETQGLIRKIVLIECADYEKPVGIPKLQEDLNKLQSAKEVLKDNAIIMHVSKKGYSPDASGYALERGIEIFSYDDLTSQLINFNSYIKAVKEDPARKIILNEYQPNKIHYEGKIKTGKLSLTFFRDWINSSNKWLTLLGDYGVGKSWTLKTILYDLIDQYSESNAETPLPFFIPLQYFTKAFDFKNLILRTFQMYGLSGVHYDAFVFLMNEGKIVFLLDSFDEMAQHLNRNTIRENLKEILVGISKNSKAVMTSRPNYFEGRAERLLVVERDGEVSWHPLDRKKFEYQNILSGTIKDRLESSQFARINDLSVSQRRRLFKIVLGANSAAFKQLDKLIKRFNELDDLSNRAVIARLLTTVAETISSSKETKTIDGYPLIPDDLKTLNQAKIFEIIIYNLLGRDDNIGSLSAAQRLYFLRSLSVFLQQKNRHIFATPDEIRSLVKELFKYDLKRSDTPEQLLEGYYRTCRRHSGLTTESQFADTSGQIDFPVDEDDSESNVGFSHNSIREFLIADAIADLVQNDNRYLNIDTVIYNDLIGDFFVWKTEYNSALLKKLKEKYNSVQQSNFLELLFKIIFRFIQIKPDKHKNLLGKTPVIKNIDISGIDFSGISLQNGYIEDCLAIETDFRKMDLRNVSFKNTIFDNAMLDDAIIDGADFRETEIESIYVYDPYVTNTTSLLSGRNARQWLYSKGAKVFPDDDLNLLMGKPWYEAAREVTRTIEHRLPGTHQDVSLAKGTKKENRKFAEEFVDFLISKKVLLKVTRSKTGPGWVLKVDKKSYSIITAFSKEGKIHKKIAPFFQKYLPDDQEIDSCIYTEK
jgi:hypothetical protein